MANDWLKPTAREAIEEYNALRKRGRSDDLMGIDELVSIYPRLQAGESVREPQDWAQCYHEDITQLRAHNAAANRRVDAVKERLHRAGLQIAQLEEHVELLQKELQRQKESKEIGL